MKKITKDSYIKNFFELRYRDIVLKPALKIINKHQKKAEIIFWTMPFDSICREIILNKLYERDLLNGMCSIVKDKNTVALDVGANIGNHSLYFAKHFKKVISFEPAPSNCWIFKANIFLNRVKNVVLIEKGLSNKNLKMSVDGNPENTNSGLSEYSDNAVDRINVDIVVGDGEIEKLNLSDKIGLIKIDVEGQEPYVVEGLKKVITKNKPILFWEAFSKNEAEKTKNKLKEMGYSNFYHLTINRYNNRFLNKLKKAFSKSAYLIEFDKCKRFDGMNVASIKKLV